VKVAVLGGTGKIGSGVAKQLAKMHQVVIGSRDPAKAKKAAMGIRGATGADYASAAREADAVVFALPYSALETASALAKELSGKLVISTVNPLKYENGLAYHAPRESSAAQELAKLIPESRVATAFNNVPAAFLQQEEVASMDIMIAADSEKTYQEAARIVGSIPNMRPLYAGSLSQAAMVEGMTAVVLNLARLNKTGVLTTKFVSRKD
jgi:NADPH-dependent F420 reductase